MANFFQDLIDQFNIIRPQPFLTSKTPLVKSAQAFKVGTDNFFAPLIKEFTTEAPKAATALVKGVQQIAETTFPIIKAGEQAIQQQSFQPITKFFTEEVPQAIIEKGETLRKGFSPGASKEDFTKAVDLTTNTVIGFLAPEEGAIKKIVTKEATEASALVEQPQLLKTPPKLPSPLGGEKPPIEPHLKTLSSGEIIPPKDSLVNRVTKALQEAKPIRAEQEKLYRKERAKRFGKAEAVGEEVKGEKGFFIELSKLKGELPKAEFEPLRGKFGQDEIDQLFQMVKENPWLKFTDTLEARGGLIKMIEGNVPTNSELGQLNKVFPPEMMKALMDKRPLLEKIKDIGLQIANLPRSFMSSVDLSFGGRQGIFAAPTYRKEFWDSWKAQFKMFGSEKAYQEAMQEIAKNPYFNLAKESGISFTNVGESIAQREEKFASSWGDSIPLIKQSGRAYTGFSNKFRMDIFASIARDIEATGEKLKNNPELAKSVSSLVNAMTGRGDLPTSLSRVAPVLNSFFFSPRLMASRIRLLTGAGTYINTPTLVRQQALKSLIGFTGYIITVLTLAKLVGADIGTDPRSSDFAKIKIGNTRIDIMGGFQQYIRMAAQLIIGKYVSSTTGKEITLGEGYKPLTRMDILQRQIESKEAPIFSFITALLKGTDFQGKPLNISKEIGQRFVPMVIQDIYDIAKSDPKLLPLGVLGIFGIGLQTYQPNKPFSTSISGKGIKGRGIKR